MRASYPPGNKEPKGTDSAVDPRHSGIQRDVGIRGFSFAADH